jgi:hypothetical protein
MKDVGVQQGKLVQMNTISISRPPTASTEACCMQRPSRHPRFNPNSFWNYQATCDVVGAGASSLRRLA